MIAHLEGPFVSPHMLGAQPLFNIEPTAELVAEAVATGCVRVVTITPELKHAPTALKAFAQAGVRVSLGHNTTKISKAPSGRSVWSVPQVEPWGGRICSMPCRPLKGGVPAR